jgi:hypothetical protein
MINLKKSLIYLLIFTAVSSFFAYRIIVSAYETTYSFDTEGSVSLKSN